MQANSNYPLISVVIVSYNSSKYIIETLESVKKQTYPIIELIISDDCSKDSTVRLCEEWLQDNNSRFIRSTILTSNVNTGVTANCKRAYDICEGEWIKGIGADDILLEHCLEDNYLFIKSNEEAQIVFSGSNKFFTKGDTLYIGDDIPCEKYRSILLSSKETQLANLYSCCYLPQSTSFVKNDLYKKIGFDERYRDMEDYPFFFHISQAGVNFCFLDKKTTLYRCEESLSHSQNHFVNERLYFAKKQFFYAEMFNYLRINNKDILIKRLKDFLIDDFCYIALKNRKNLLTRMISFIFMRTL